MSQDSGDSHHDQRLIFAKRTARGELRGREGAVRQAAAFPLRQLVAVADRRYLDQFFPCEKCRYSPDLVRARRTKEELQKMGGAWGGDGAAL